MDLFRQDLRYALRSLGRTPGFTLVASLTLALGLGANTAMFSVIQAVLLRPLPYQEPDRLVMVWEHNLPRQRDRNVVSPANYLRWRERATSFTDLAMYTWSSTVFTGGDAPERVSGRSVTTNLFSVLGAQPVLGRVFTAEEGVPGGPEVILLSHGLWQRRFGGDPSVVGRQVAIAGGTVTVVGVMPAAFRALGTEEYWEPFTIGAETREPQGRYAMVLGRLKPGISPERAGAEMITIARGLESEFPDFDTGWSTTVVPLTEQVVGGARQMLLVLLGAVALVLLIACANVANLTLVRATGRARETAVRVALGAPRGRLVRQWLLESLVLAALGGAAGLLLGVWGVDLLKALAPSDVPRLTEIRLDGGVLVVTALVVLIVGVLAGLPAAVGIRSRHSALAEATQRTTAGGASQRWRQGLVVVQLALALMLLAGAGLMVRSLSRLLAVNPGFDPAGVLTVELSLPSALYEDGPRRNAFFDRVLEQVRGMPGVTTAGVVSALPLTGLASATSFRVVGRPEPAAGQWPVADIRSADEGYFPALGIPLKRGRLPAPADAPSSPPVVVINETMARQLWPDGDPIGARVRVNWNDPEMEPEVVGVVGDVRHTGLDGDVRPMIYYPRWQSPSGYMVLVVRSVTDPLALAASIRGVVRQLDPALPMGDIAPMHEYVSRSVADRRYPMLLLGLFGGLAVTLAAIGLYGVVAHGVGLRSREFGVRIALGASPGDLARLVLSGAGALAVGGVVLGTAGALASTRVLTHLLYGVAPSDPGTLVAAAVLLALVVLFAAWLPARRAARVDPMTALRSE
jgi:putative ABC transport system permease protein